MPKNKQYNLVVETPRSTVVTEYTSTQKRTSNYQSEAELESTFIEQMQAQAYEYINITKEENLIINLRKQLEKLNQIQFTNQEWNNFYKSEIANLKHTIVEKTNTIQVDYIKVLKRDDGTEKNIYLLKKDNIHDNQLQIINQYVNETEQRKNRYDVTILVNGLPLVHIELKRRGIALKEAFNQINRYQRESFWSGSGLFEYVQLFVISNGTRTKYYSNTTRSEHLRKDQNKMNRKGKYANNSFEFTNWWADSKNQSIADLIDFTKTFFAKHTILNILTRYCVFTVNQQLLVMRPYQITATEKIINKITISQNYKKFGTSESGGYIWHTTGSGKTLTSFKTAQLVEKFKKSIAKVLFVVDRKDLDYQTMREYDKFKKGVANGNKSTAALKKQLESANDRIIITTIQKLDRFIKQNAMHNVFNEEIVIIFDECHRSQFGEMHRAITKSFQKYYLFGFTGTPIFAANASTTGRKNFKTTAQIFGDKLHSYTIVDAINDKNVLPFKVDYLSGTHEKENITQAKVKDIDREAFFQKPRRMQKIVEYILEHFDQKTKRNRFYQLETRRLRGFNSIFAVSSIEAAMKYYAEFKKQMKSVPSDKKLKIAMIYSFGVNDEEIDGLAEENSEDTSKLSTSSREFLEKAIADYNKMFNTSFDTSSHKFQNYYKKLSERVKNREIDILIVVNMFLTGFDATTLNTLWVDKNLRLHGLLQAYSRTNRILNAVKTHGNIVCFRNLEKATKEAIALFGNKDAQEIVLLKTYSEYYYGYEENGKKIQGYKDLIAELQTKYPLKQSIKGEQNQKNFIKLYGKILWLRNILETFDDFVENEILTFREMQDYQSHYLDLYHLLRTTNDNEKENINDDVIFEMDLIKQIEINVDYILNLINQYQESHQKKHLLLKDIEKSIDSSLKLRNKKDLIMQFVNSLNVDSSVDDNWQKFVTLKKNQALEEIIENENLNHEAIYKFIKNAFRNGSIPVTGSEIAEIVPRSISRFTPGGERQKKRESILQKLTAFFDKFFDISGEKW